MSPTRERFYETIPAEAAWTGGLSSRRRAFICMALKANFFFPVFCSQLHNRTPFSPRSSSTIACMSSSLCMIPRFSATLHASRVANMLVLSFALLQLVVRAHLGKRAQKQLTSSNSTFLPPPTRLASISIR